MDDPSSLTTQLQGWLDQIRTGDASAGAEPRAELLARHGPTERAQAVAFGPGNVSARLDWAAADGTVRTWEARRGVFP